MVDNSDAPKTLRQAVEFVKAGLLSKQSTAEIEKVAEQFSLSITPEMQDQIACGEDDPVAKQFVPTVEELNTTKDELLDPIGDAAFTAVKGIVHRYPDRCLFKPVNLCAVYCRFCFRREKVGPGNEALTLEELETAYDYIRGNKNIWEVILTGGDPLILKPKKLDSIMKQLDAIEHVKVVRIHTRIPVVDSKRINDAMLSALTLKNKPTYIVLHVNHANEFSTASKKACASLVDNGFPLLSQTVLLKSINDNAETLSSLMRLLVENRIKPYYLHHADKAKGTSHFRTSINEGREIVSTMQGRLSGICQPTYVLDIPGGHGKVPLLNSPASEVDESDCQYSVKDYQGRFHVYIDTEES